MVLNPTFQANGSQSTYQNNPNFDANGGGVNGFGGTDPGLTPLKFPTADQGSSGMGPFPSNSFASGPSSFVPSAVTAGTSGNPNPTGQQYNSGQSGGTFGTPNWKPTFQNYSGYNPSQYADLNTTNQLAQSLGGNALQTRMAGTDPFGVPPQNSIDFGGNSPLNAGLLAERYQKYDKATADAMTQAELGIQGPRQAPNADSRGGSMGSWSQFQGLPGGTQNAGNSQFRIGGAQQTPGLGNGGQGGSQFWSGGAPNPGAQQRPPQFGQQFGQSQGFRGGFGNAQQFAAQNNPQMQLLQMLLGGGGGNGAFGQGGGNMSGIASFLNQFRQRSPQQGFAGMNSQGFNPFSQGPNFGGGQNGNQAYTPRFY